MPTSTHSINPTQGAKQLDSLLKQLTSKQREKFSRPLNEACQFGIYNIDSAKRPETLPLLKQSLNTITHAEKSLAKYNFVDTYILLRSSLEFLINTVSIEKNDEAYNEFIKLSPIGKHPRRNKTQPAVLINQFAKFLYSNYLNFTPEGAEEDCATNLTQLYSLLCYYTHASIVVSVISNTDDTGKNKHLHMLMMITLYQVKWYLYLTIMYFVGSEPTITFEDAGKAYFIQAIKTILWAAQRNIDYTEQKDALYLHAINGKFKSAVLHEYSHAIEEVGANRFTATNLSHTLLATIKNYLKN